MGGGGYSYADAHVRSMSYAKKAVTDNLSAREVSREMKSVGVSMRESRDSDEHPASKAIIIGLDVTASMGTVPQELVSGGLPKVMKRALEDGVKDPQIMFLGIGDHHCDHSPLQVGQFESSDELMEKWLMKIWLEYGGGGNSGESYQLAWYFASRHTEIDCWEKRKDKGLIITIGDEAVHPTISSEALGKVMGGNDFPTKATTELLADAREMYDVHHINILDWSGRQPYVRREWKEMLGDGYHEVEGANQIPDVISEIMIAKYRDTNYGSPVDSGSTEGIDGTESFGEPAEESQGTIL